jgi:transcriptional regulator with XRE-family HTH domain
VRRLRHLAGLTLEELSQRAGLTPSYIGSIELGDRDPSLSTMEAIASGLDIAVGELFGGVAELSPEGLELAALFEQVPDAVQTAVLAILHTTGDLAAPEAKPTRKA